MLSLAHSWQHRADQRSRAEKVCLELPAYALFLTLFNRCQITNTGIVDKNVNRAEVGLSLANDTGNLLPWVGTSTL